MDEVLQRVYARAEEQHSMINIEQIRDCGASRKWIERRTADGLIIPDGPSVFRMPGVPRTFLNQAHAAVLSCKASALISHRSAAYLHGFDRIDEPALVEITVPRHRRPRARTGLKVHESLAFDDALRQRIVSWDELWDCYLAHNVTGRNVAPFRRILLERDGNTPPGGEFARRMAEMLTGAGLPMPVFEHRVVVAGHEYYLDLAWPHRMVAVECNDAGSHDTPKAFRRDPMKRNRCEGAGWRYLEFTWWDMVLESVEVLAQVAAALECRV